MAKKVKFFSTCTKHLFKQIIYFIPGSTRYFTKILDGNNKDGITEMKSLLIIILIALITLAFTTCGENTIGPEFPPGRRDYTWTVDTLKLGNEHLYLMRIWGSSPTDVWAVGSSSATFTTIWHYDGNQWRCDSIQRNVNPSALYGFAQNDIWMGNTNSTIWRYNGSNWIKHSEHKLSDFKVTWIIDFAGKSRDDFYAVGYAINSPTKKDRAVIMKYKNGNWSFVNIPDINVIFGSCVYDKDIDALVISGLETDPKGFKARIFYYDGNNITEYPITTIGSACHAVSISGNIYITAGIKFYVYANNQLKLWHDNTNTQLGQVLCGRNSSDIFVNGLDGVYHYNGKDFERLYNKTFELGRGIVFEKEVFLMGYIPQIGKSVVMHGKLN